MGNRIIKFRAWDSLNKRMVQDYFWIDPDGGVWYDVDPHGVDMSGKKKILPVDRLSVMQFTGLHDKKGKEIYEGDILAYPSAHPKHEGKIFNNVVEFASGQTICGWRMRNKSCIVKATHYKFAISEIIGNIHQTPDLL